VIGSNDGIKIEFIKVFNDETESDELQKCFKEQRRYYEICRIVDLNNALRKEL
jgi:hypothetical protein